MSRADLVARCREMGLPTVGTVSYLEGLIAAEEVSRSRTARWAALLTEIGWPARASTDWLREVYPYQVARCVEAGEHLARCVEALARAEERGVSEEDLRSLVRLVAIESISASEASAQVAQIGERIRR